MTVLVLCVFLDLTLAGDVPDSRTVWHFREQITGLRPVEKLFDLFLKELSTHGPVINEGKIIDASFVEVPRQCNREAENERIKEGKGEELWNERPRRQSQKDIDARWTQKNKTNYYGYKNHVKKMAKAN